MVWHHVFMCQCIVRDEIIVCLIRRGVLVMATNSNSVRQYQEIKYYFYENSHHFMFHIVFKFL